MLVPYNQLVCMVIVEVGSNNYAASTLRTASTEYYCILGIWSSERRPYTVPTELVIGSPSLTVQTCMYWTSLITLMATLVLPTCNVVPLQKHNRKYCDDCLLWRNADFESQYCHAESQIIQLYWCAMEGVPPSIVTIDIHVLMSKEREQKKES
jgi:hypothetical protein